MDAPRYVGYVRVSTSEQGSSGLGLRAQRDAIRAASSAPSWTLVGLREEVASGARADNRPVLAELLASMRRGELDGIVVAKLDRLSRSLADFADLLARARREGWNLVALDLGVDLSTPHGEFLAGVMASVAQWERRIIGQRTSEALRALPRERRNGRPCFSEDVRVRARALRDRGLTLQGIVEALEAEGVRPPRGGSRLRASTVSRLLEEVRDG